jgi:hypothetical protein
MKTFLAIYLGAANTPKGAEWERLDEAKKQARVAEGMKAWGDWMANNRAAIVVEGGPLGKTKHVSDAGVSGTKNAMTGYVVVRAESHDAAARMFENHPHFAIFPGDAVEIMECLPIPGQS